MSRREQNRTDQSVASVTESLKSLMATGLRYAGDISGLTFLDETSLGQYGPEQVLMRMLSTTTYISTHSSLAEDYQGAHDHTRDTTVKAIGKGQTGEVWAIIGTMNVIKVANPNKSDNLWNECKRHKRIQVAFESTPLALRRDINIPKFGDWVVPNNALFWNDLGHLFPAGFEPDYGLVSTRIFPLPLPVRSAIVDQFAPRDIKKNKDSFLLQPQNKDCLVRIYLGRRAARTGTFGLRNFAMTVNEMEQLRLETDVYANILAQSLAIIHWKAGLDANDVKFVLGSSPQVKMSASLSDYEAATKDDAMFIGQEFDFQHRSTGVWLLDFDQCQEFPKTDEGVQQLVRGFFWNDPYYPRPVSKDAKDVALWNTFKGRYLEVSSNLTETTLPDQFIAAVEEHGRTRAEGGSLFN